MNQRFFGDSKDLFKYDLILTIMKQLKDELGSFTFIPMLTQYDSSTEKRSAGRDNKTLMILFNPFSGKNATEKYFNEIKNYFEYEGIQTNILNDMLFTRKDRTEYFEKIVQQLPEKSLIFFDPDTGLAEKNATEKHIKFSELGKFYERMDKNSIVMVYQHFPRYSNSENRKKFPEKIASQVTDEIRKSMFHISDNSVMFLFVTKNGKLKVKLEKILNQYKKQYSESFNR